jgi:hypothetical protein
MKRPKKKCPFCGGNPLHMGWYVCCMDCGAKGPSIEMNESPDLAVEKWEKRLDKQKEI